MIIVILFVGSKLVCDFITKSPVEFGFYIMSTDIFVGTGPFGWGSVFSNGRLIFAYLEELSWLLIMIYLRAYSVTSSKCISATMVYWCGKTLGP